MHFFTVAALDDSEDDDNKSQDKLNDELWI